MEITLEAIISLVGLFIGGTGLTGFFFWRQHKRKEEAEAKAAEAEAKLKEAEAKQKEAEAKAAEVDMAQKVQDTYQQMLDDKGKEVEDNKRLIEELRQDRDHYKQGYVEFRDQLDKLQKEFRDFRNETEEQRTQMKRDIARNARMVESLLPFTCGLAPECQKCVPVRLSDTGEVEKTVRPEDPNRKRRKPKAEIEPLNNDDM